jgi:prepilin-type processing-associated H-X9-DG protein/prepilin-type N-terminal cleavage/methylation domain-containing protein
MWGAAMIRIDLRRRALTLIEFLVVLAIIAVLLALLLPAVQRVREAASRTQCQNHLRQLVLAAHHHHEEHGQLPAGWLSGKPPGSERYTGWLVRLLPYVEQTSLALSVPPAFAISANPFKSPPHLGLVTVISTFGCPADDRVLVPQIARSSRRLVALTSYLGVSGTDSPKQDGVLFRDSQLRWADVVDGTATTLMIGERPPSADLQFGWWYAGQGQTYDGSADQVLGLQETNRLTARYPECTPGAYSYMPGQLTHRCAVFHFWAPHAGGANFAFCDGSVKTISYTSKLILPALATRAGGEAFDEHDGL